MPHPTPTADRLFDRPWRPGHHPFGKSPSRLRRWFMVTTLLVLCSLIGAYLYYTDTDRVRSMAQSYLSHILRGRIEIGAAKLSIFEGLRLQDVRVYVDETNDAPDAVLFSAEAFLIKYDPRVLITGRLEADQIIAIDPHVRLTENIDTGRWNYQRLVRERREPVTQAKPGPEVVLPEILLRNAQVDYSEVRGGQYVELGSLAIEGRLTPSADAQRYRFELQSRGQSEGVGPVVSGSFSRTTGHVSARLARFEFGRDIRTMLPAEVRNWWEAHELSGRVNIPALSYTPARDGKPAVFKVETDLDGVTLAVRPDEWLSREELFQRASSRWVYDQVRWMEKAGFPTPNTNARHSSGPVSLATRMAAMFDLPPVRLQRVSGAFVFTKDGVNDGVEIKDVGGRVENNALVINGRIEGFSPVSAARITVASRQTEHIYIPPAPQYVASMPRQVREIYDHLKPQGTCDIKIQFSRPTAGGRPEVSGEINIVDGNFVFDRFPYPVRQATGRIAFGYDKLLGWDKLELINLRGRGVEGGPNAEAVFVVQGEIGPLAGDTGVNVRISAPNVTNEPALTAAFPEEVRESLRVFDPTQTGAFPKYRGSFQTDVFRPPGKFQRWTINTDILLKDASGALTVFPYPLEGVSGKLAIRDGYVDIIGATMKRGDATLNVDGRVRWKPELPPGSKPLIATTKPAAIPGAPKQPSQIAPDLKIVARNVPIDENLLSAMPGDRRMWIERIGVGGVIDVDGRVFRKAGSEQLAFVPQPAANARAGTADEKSPPPSLASLIDQDFQITLRNGTAWPGEGTFAVSGLTGQMRLTSDRLVLSDFKGRRGDADLTGRGTITWVPTTTTPQLADNARADAPESEARSSSRAHVALSAQAVNLALDSSLYQALPTVAKEAWDQVRPEGTVDVDLSYSGAPGDETKPQPSAPIAAADGVQSAVETLAPATAAPGVASGFDITIKPRKLAANLKALPYRLDDLAGAINVSGSKLTLTDLTAKHGDARLKLSGTGVVGPRSNWELKLAATDVPVDDALREAVPTVIADLFESLKLQGIISFDFSPLALRGDLSKIGSTTRPASGPSSAAEPPLAASRTNGGSGVRAAASAKPQAEKQDFDMDFAVRMTTPAATMDVGVPLTDVNGVVTLAGTVRKGEMSELKGMVEAQTLKLAGRPGRALHTEMVKRADRDELVIGPITGELAGGEIAGNVKLAFPDEGPSHYAMELALRNADVKQIAAETEQDISGHLTARLALEGNWSDASARRGRGDVRVEGKEMYKI